MRVLKVLFFLVLFSTQFQTAEAQTQKEHLIAWWNFDDSTATDFSGNGYHGTMMNNPTPVEGKDGIGTALRFSGGGYSSPSGAHVVLPMIDFNKFDEFTVSMWVYEENMDPWLGDAYIWFGEWDKGFLAIMNHYDQHQENDLSLRYLRLSFTVGGHGDHANERIVVPYDSTEWRDNWVNYVMTYNRDTIRAYVNGSLIGKNMQHVSVGGNTAGLNRHWWNNANTSCTRLNGIMDDVRIYNIKLSDDQVDSLFQDDLLKISGSDFCEGESAELYATAGFDSYEWSTGETTVSITVNSGGNYSVIAKRGDQEYSNSFDVTMFPAPKPIIEGDLILLENEEGDIYVQQDFDTYLWDSGEKTKSIHITKPGYYGVTVTDENGCTGYTTIEVKSNCYTVYAYADFKTAEHLEFVGKAQKRDSVIHLTRSMLKEAGGIWIDDKVNVADGFTVSFAFRLIDGHDASIPEASPEGADGIAFVIQNSEKNALGRIASAMGYAGIKNSIAIEYDAFCNDDLQISSNNDPNGSHVAVQSAGLEMNTQVHGDDVTLAMADDIPEFVADSRKYYSKIEYSSTLKKLTVYIDTIPELITPVIVKENFNLSELLDLEFGKQAWIGLTAATGDGRQIHELVDLYICLYGPTVGVDESVLSSNNNDIQWNPNPAADAASLAFNMKYAADVELSIFDISGQKLTTIISEFRESGQYRQHFDMSGLTPGVYISILKIGSERIVNKIIKTY